MQPLLLAMENKKVCAFAQDLKSGNVLLTTDGHAKIADVVS